MLEIPESTTIAYQAEDILVGKTRVLPYSYGIALQIYLYVFYILINSD